MQALGAEVRFGIRFRNSLRGWHAIELGVDVVAALERGLVHFHRNAVGVSPGGFAENREPFYFSSGRFYSPAPVRILGPSGLPAVLTIIHRG